jgi:hypothetical protein
MTKQEFLDQALENASSLTDEQLETIFATKHLLAIQTGVVVFCCHGIRNALSDFWDTPHRAFTEVFYYVLDTVYKRWEEYKCITAD